jgi:DNA-binding FadR family transcriptional regulator
MILPKIESEFLRYLLVNGHPAGERLPSLAELSAETGMSMGKLREQFEVARMLGLVEASPRRGIVRTEYSFLPAVRLSLLAALAINPAHFDAFSGLRAHLETAYWDEAVALLTEEDFATLRSLVAAARAKLSEPRIQIPYQEHRELHLTIYRQLDNPFRRRAAGGVLGCVRSSRTEHIRRLRLSARSMALSRADRRCDLSWRGCRG